MGECPRTLWFRTEAERRENQPAHKGRRIVVADSNISSFDAVHIEAERLAVETFYRTDAEFPENAVSNLMMMY